MGSKQADAMEAELFGRCAAIRAEVEARAQSDSQRPQDRADVHTLIEGCLKELLRRDQHGINENDGTICSRRRRWNRRSPGGELCLFRPEMTSCGPRCPGNSQKMNFQSLTVDSFFFAI